MRTDPSSFRADEARREPSFRMSTAQLGMILFLASLAVLFVATLVAYWVTRSNNKAWAGMQVSAPLGLAAATLLLAGVSTSIQGAVRAIRRNQPRVMHRRVLLTLSLACGFLLTQAKNWHDVLDLNPGLANRELSLFAFYMLTGVHALHVIGGLVPLSLVLYRNGEREYSSSRHRGVRFCAQYWHFLGIVWLVLLGTMLGI